MNRELANAVILLEQGIQQSNRPEDRKLASDYLAALAPLLASAVLEEDILSRLDDIERLFGHSWIVDPKPFQNAFDSWRKFREEYEAFALGGMTVNERLYALRTLDDYTKAVKERNFDRMEQLLRRARVDQPSILRIITNAKESNG